MRTALLLFGFLAAACAHAPETAPPPAAHHPPKEAAFPHRFEDPGTWAPRFEDPARDVWQKPDEVIAALKLRPNDRVADIGSATGYFPVRLARALPLGKVYGVDIEPGMTGYLADRAANEGLSNVKAILGTAEDPQLPEKVDMVLVVDTFHHITHRPVYFENLKRHVAPDARLAIIDFRKDSPVGPPPAHRVSAAEIEADLKKAGWAKLEQHDFLPYQHFLIFEPVRRPGAAVTVESPR
jgi:ubiquinone/menaquinone biosynthesis C-methylase UbiE